ncbi:DUF4186 domain-containing protein [Erwinia mallotivora]|uniref:DUF4186 domain-containing protein n=1 Tax=Erwinia mallotivora TaxID=69222 RepID=UPI0035ED6EB8
MIIDDVVQRLAASAFRQRFHLGQREYHYCRKRGEAEVRRHAQDFINMRLAPAVPASDGKQTPMRGHPVFIAQHATATCCRGCLSKWHAIPAMQPLTQAQQAYIVAVIMRWLEQEMQRPLPPEKKTRKKSRPQGDQQLELFD